MKYQHQNTNNYNNYNKKLTKGTQSIDCLLQRSQSPVGGVALFSSCLFCVQTPCCIPFNMLFLYSQDST